MSKAVIVTTEFRGVFFGHVKSKAKVPAEITLTSARNCIYWSKEIGGFMGLASVGPDSNCRIGKQVDEITVYKITSVIPVDKAAAEKWEKA